VKVTRSVLLASIVAGCSLVAAAPSAQGDVWLELFPDTKSASHSSSQHSEQDVPVRYLSFDKAELARIVEEGLSSSMKTFSLELPIPTGEFRRFEFRRSTTLSPGLSAKFPEIQAFEGRSIDKDGSTAQLELTTSGLSAQILDVQGRWMIDSIDGSDASKVRSYFARDDSRAQAPLQCGFDHDPIRGSKKTASNLLGVAQRPAAAGEQSRSRGAELRTYRLAIATTGEYSEYHGGTTEDTLSAVVRVVNRINGIFNAELSVGFELVENIDEILFTDPLTDPFEGNDDLDVLIDESQSVIDEVIGEANYDIGHTFSSTGGGLAGIGPCRNGSKASGVTGGTEGEFFIVDFVAHEMGHQFGMFHTFNSSAESCVDNREGSAAFEPGAGSTIMSYNGLCGADNIPQNSLLASNSDPMFHSFSYEQAADYLETFGSVCGVGTDTGNRSPQVDAGKRYSVPSGTPLIIEGDGSDPDGHELTYSWEQRDLGSAASLSSADDGSIPLFRALAPSTTPIRYLPKLSTVVSGEVDNVEKLPRVARTMTMVVTARDQRGGVNSDTTSIEVISPPLTERSFSIEEPNFGGDIGSEGTVRWNVGGTDEPPISVNEIDLFLSIDGGNTFSTEPFATVANTGYARVAFPDDVDTDSARIMARGSGNIFFDISDEDLSLDGSAPATPEVPAPLSVTAYGLSDQTIEISFQPGGGGGISYHEAACTGDPTYSSFSASDSPEADFDDTSPARSSVVVNGEGVVPPEGLTVDVDITHTYRGDVVIDLVAPTGRAVQLKSNDGADGADDVVETYTVVGMLGEEVAGEWLLKVSDYYEGDEGTFNSWSLSGAGITPPRLVQGSVRPDAYFDDATPISSSIQLSAEGTVSIDEFRVAIDITHTWRSDVAIELESPGGKRITLREIDTDDSGDNVTGVYPTTLNSKTPFSELAGESLAGTWTLYVSDKVPQDTGVLNSWGITQAQYTFAETSEVSPIELAELPAGQSYSCEIWAINSAVTPPRQSASRPAGTVTLGSVATGRSAPIRFLNLLQSTDEVRSPSSGPEASLELVEDAGARTHTVFSNEVRR